MNTNLWHSIVPLDNVPEDKKEKYAILFDNSAKYLLNLAEERISEHEKALITNHYFNIVKGVLDNITFPWSVMGLPVIIGENGKAVNAMTRKLKTRSDIFAINEEELIQCISQEMNEYFEYYEDAKVYFYVPIMLMGYIERFVGNTDYPQGCGLASRFGVQK